MNPKLKKYLVITAGAIIILMAAVILFISPITKYLIEKYDEKYTGRKMELSWAYVNPFTGYIHLSGLKIYESKSDSVFFSTEGLSINVELLKMLSGTYEITEFTLDEPKSTIIQNKRTFNFDDLLERFVPKKTDTAKAPAHFNILNVKVNDGQFYYREEAIGVNYFIKKVNFESSGMRWDVDTIQTAFSFLSGPGSGDVKGKATFNTKDLNYRVAVIANKFDLKTLEQYIRDMSNYGSFEANIDADIQAVGNLNDEENVTTKGIMTINDFHFGKSRGDDYASFDKLVIDMKEVSPKKHIYLFDSISVKHPFFKYERYDHLDNLQNMFGENGANVTAEAADQDKYNLVIEIARYIKVLSKNFFQSDYKISRVAAYDTDLKFNDYSLSEKFSMDLNPLYVFADSINKDRKRVEVVFNSAIKPYGNVSVNISINPKDSSDFDMDYHLDKLPSAMFNPYMVSYTSFSLDRGTMEFKGNWHVQNGVIKSENHFLMIDPRTTKRLRNRDTKWVPVPLMLSFIRERGNVIDYQIPITGDLKDPKFHLHDVILDLIKNIFIKPPTTPYILRVDNIETEIEKSLNLTWNMRQCIFGRTQEKFIERMADFLEKNPEASIKVRPEEYAVKEKEHILFFEAKKKYFLIANSIKNASFSENDSMNVDKMSAKDSAFTRYLNKVLNDSMLFTIQDKCTRFVGEKVIENIFLQLTKKRKENFMAYFKERKVDGRVKIYAGENVVPFNGFSFYKIDYEGTLPEPLLNAYHKISELDDEEPRKKYKGEREKNDFNRIVQKAR